MEFKATLKGVTQDYFDNKLQITFCVDNSPQNASFINEIGNLSDIRLSATKWRKKRSLDANAYAWKLMSEIARAENISKDEVYEQILMNHPIFDEDDEGNHICVALLKYIDVKKLGGHWLSLGETKDGRCIQYIKLKGTSEYDSAEMKWFIDEVIVWAKEDGIETLTPAEIERMKELWQKA